jgi:hypothetical protein
MKAMGGGKDATGKSGPNQQVEAGRRDRARGFVIQDCASGIYFAGLGTWTGEMNKALGFLEEKSAEEFVRSQNLRNVRVVSLRT